MLMVRILLLMMGGSYKGTIKLNQLTKRFFRGNWRPLAPDKFNN